MTLRGRAERPPPVGATVRGPSTHFEVWAPVAAAVELVLGEPGPDERAVPMASTTTPGRWAVDVASDAAGHGTP